jgi:hypothetical protein
MVEPFLATMKSCVVPGAIVPIGMPELQALPLVERKSRSCFVVELPSVSILSSRLLAADLLSRV